METNQQRKEMALGILSEAGRMLSNIRQVDSYEVGSTDYDLQLSGVYKMARRDLYVQILISNPLVPPLGPEEERENPGKLEIGVEVGEHTRFLKQRLDNIGKKGKNFHPVVSNYVAGSKRPAENVVDADPVSLIDMVFSSYHTYLESQQGVGSGGD